MKFIMSFAILLSMAMAVPAEAGILGVIDRILDPRHHAPKHVVVHKAQKPTVVHHVVQKAPITHVVHKAPRAHAANKPSAVHVIQKDHRQHR